MLLIILAIIIAIASVCRIAAGYDIGTGFAGIFMAVILAGYEVCPAMMNNFI